MVAVIFGFLLMAFAVFAFLPMGLNWDSYVIEFLKGASPVIAAFVGIISVLIGFADMKDRREAKREEEEARKAEEDSKKRG
ncbi:MAG: hypothetical protein KBT11_01095 [Treponema sp.]|nr:hypothetical protein [Candidatus Treponema equifaecale]